MNHSRGKPLESLDPRESPRGSRFFRRGRHSGFSTSMLIAVVVVLVVGIGVPVLLVAAGDRSQQASTKHKSVRQASLGNSRVTTTEVVTTTTDSGSLPQTDAFPADDSTQFESE